MQTSSMWFGTVVVLLIGCSITIICVDVQRCSCVTGPPDYLCPTAPLLQVYLTHELYCTRYYKCTDGRAIEFQCPYGLYFDSVNDTCTCDFTLCYRTDPCIQFVDSCRCCAQQFDNTGLAPENFYVCYNDGYAVATTCPEAYDPCNDETIQLEFINGKCEVPPKFLVVSDLGGSDLVGGFLLGMFGNFPKSLYTASDKSNRAASYSTQDHRPHLSLDIIRMNVRSTEIQWNQGFKDTLGVIEYKNLSSSSV
ncbi:uncharacterized protein LOC125769561 [Anopheles funestus]|uniref:uncharacterized protein LOC125769561 n=1 Tax=Anopheles funestus TaxID=62324 RepID=UPI0020C65A90|nr:uncharacterized protein LOC125769561 [Anopheles funestus]